MVENVLFMAHEAMITRVSLKWVGQRGLQYISARLQSAHSFSFFTQLFENKIAFLI